MVNGHPLATEQKITLKIRRYSKFCALSETKGMFINMKIKGKKLLIRELCSFGDYVEGFRLKDGWIKGKKFEDEKVIAEGVFFNGLLSGQGEYYHKNGEIRFKGNLKGYMEFTGFGKEYYANDNLKYEGEYNCSIWHGEGKYYDEAGALLYEGLFENGTPAQK